MNILLLKRQYQYCKPALCRRGRNSKLCASYSECF